jgi:hypothetical protein
MQTGYWKTGVRICDMDNQHLVNTIRYLERKADEETEKTGESFEDTVEAPYWLFLEEISDRLSNEKIIGFEIKANRVRTLRLF